MKRIILAIAIVLAVISVSKTAHSKFMSCPPGTVLDKNSDEKACIVDAPECANGITESNQESCSTDIVVQQ